MSTKPKKAISHSDVTPDTLGLYFVVPAPKDQTTACAKIAKDSSIKYSKTQGGGHLLSGVG